MNNEPREVMSRVSDEPTKTGETAESGPHLGLFYVVDGELFWEGVPTAQAEGTPYFKAFPMKHKAYWKGTLVRRRPQLKKYGPYHFPRGLVVLDRRHGTYELMTDSCILEDSELIHKIVSEMGLPAQKVHTSLDISCECAACKKFRHQIDPREDPCFETTSDGRRLFRLAETRSSRGGYRGYVIPSYGEYRSLRTRIASWRRFGTCLTLFWSVLFFIYVEYLSGELWMAITLIMLPTIPLIYYHFVWIPTQRQHLKEIEKTD